MKNQLKIYGMTVLLLVVCFSGCINQESDNENSEQTTDELSFTIDFIRKIEIAYGYYPGIVFTNNQFYVSYEVGYNKFLKIYDENFIATGDEYMLGDDEGADHQMVFGDDSFYLVGSNNLRKFDSDLNELKSVRYFDNLFSKYPEQWTGFGGLGDMLFCYADGFIYLGVPIGTTDKESEKKQDLPGDLLIQKYNGSLELVNEVMLEDVGNVPGSSMMFENGIWTIVCADKRWYDSSIIAVRYSEDGKFIDKKTISAVDDANEEFAMGLIFENGLYYVGYQHITGDLFMPIEGVIFQHVDVMLKVFDINWSLLAEIKVTDDDSSNVDTGHMGRPHLALVGNKIYVAYDSVETGKVEIFVKEYELIS
jgi:hypothetical protein